MMINRQSLNPVPKDQDWPLDKYYPEKNIGGLR